MAIYELDNSAPSLGWITMRSYDQDALETRFAHALRQFLDTLNVEGLARLIRTVLDQLIGELLDVFACLHLAFDHLIDGSIGPALATPLNPCAPSIAHDCSS